MSLDIQNFKSLFINEKAQLLYQLPSQSNTHRPSKSIQTYRPPSAQHPNFSANKNSQSTSRIVHTEGDQASPPEETPKYEGFVGGRKLVRPQSAAQLKTMNRMAVSRSMMSKGGVGKANIKPSAKLKLDRFYDNMCKIKKEEEDLNNKIGNLQNSFDMTRTKSTWNFNMNKASGKDGLQSIKTREILKTALVIPTEEDEKQYMPNQEGGSKFSSLKVTPVPSKENILANFFKEDTRKLPVNVGKEELTPTMILLREYHYDSFMKAYDGVKNDLQISSSREHARPTKPEGQKLVNSSSLLKVKDITEKARRENYTARKERQEEVSREDLTMLMTSRSSMDLDMSAENYIDIKSRRSNFASTQNMFLNTREFHGPQVSPRKGGLVENKRPMSGRKSVRPMVTTGPFYNAYKERMDEINQTDIYLQGKAMAYEGLSTYRLFSPTKREDYSLQVKEIGQKEKTPTKQPNLMIFGQKFREIVQNPKPGMKRASSSQRFRDVKTPEQGVDQTMTFKRAIKGAGGFGANRPQSSMNMSRGHNRTPVEGWALKDKLLSSQLGSFRMGMTS